MHKLKRKLIKTNSCLALALAYKHFTVESSALLHHPLTLLFAWMP